MMYWLLLELCQNMHNILKYLQGNGSIYIIYKLVDNHKETIIKSVNETIPVSVHVDPLQKSPHES